VVDVARELLELGVEFIAAFGEGVFVSSDPASGTEAISRSALSVAAAT
jgi:hypothetical protein